ncbi:FixH family protein [Ferrovibrio terrae]|jgi:nitrogen fixation protein FixH|uniref:FixH family protein n=1 Tax=Ferrovibrio terrae TaxID=2594003 RepID=UPI00313821BC
MLKTMLRQRWIPSLFVIGFLVVVAVNAVLIIAATRTFSGLVVAHPYTKGTEYSTNQKTLAAQRQLNWTHGVTVSANADGSVLLQVQWTDQAGLALGGLSVTATFDRPVERLPVQTVTLQDRGGGVYAAAVTLPRQGLWDLRLVASRGEQSFIAADRIQVP